MNLVKGDIVTIAMKLQGLGHYKPELVLTNENTGETFRESLNKIDNYLRNIGHEEFIASRNSEYEQEVSKRRPIMTLEDKLVHWLEQDGYDREEATKSIREASIVTNGSKVTITYANKVVDKELDYATVHKTRENGRVVNVETRVVFGSAERIKKRLEESPSNTINTAYVERSNLNWRR